MFKKFKQNKEAKEWGNMALVMTELSTKMNNDTIMHKINELESRMSNLEGKMSIIEGKFCE